MDRIIRESDNERLVSVIADSVRLQGELIIPAQARGIVLFAHGSGSSRRSPRNRYVATVLHRSGLATLLLDLLTEREEIIDTQTRHLRFDIGLLAARLVGATDWLLQNPMTQHLQVGYFGASTGSAAALIAATERPDAVKAIVSRGGRPDLAGSALARIRVPTLLIVGGDDLPVLAIHQEVMKHFSAEKRLEVIPGATHLFEEPGALERVAELASQWFKRYLSTQDNKPPRSSKTPLW
jgi:dienelactone hydrolase